MVSPGVGSGLFLVLELPTERCVKRALIATFWVLVFKNKQGKSPNTGAFFRTEDTVGNWVGKCRSAQAIEAWNLTGGQKVWGCLLAQLCRGKVREFGGEFMGRIGRADGV